MNAIKQMEAYSRYHENVVSLSQGIPFRHSDDSIRTSAIAAIMQNKVDQYADPQGLLALREVIAADLQKDAMQYATTEIIVTAGAIEGLTATLLSLLTTEQNEVIIPTPTYSAYFRAVEVAQGKTVCVPLHEKGEWSLDIAQLEKNINKKTAVILLCNPNNPTGTIYPKEVLDAVCQLAQKYNITLILDEVYRQMIFGDEIFYTPCVDQSFKKNIVRIVSFSKDFSLTGWRVGYLHSSVEMIQKILPVHDAMINCVPVVSQYAAIAAIENKERILAQNKLIYTKNRDSMKSYLDQLSGVLTYTMPQGSYFFFPRLLQIHDTNKFCWDLLQKADVAVVPGSDFGPGGEGHVRLCFGRSETDIKSGMERFTKYLKNMVL